RGRGPRGAAAVRRGGRRPPLGAGALHARARLVLAGRDLPARGGGRVRQDRRARERARRGERAQTRPHMTLWAGRVEGELAPEVWKFLKADDAELLPYDVE